MKWNKVSDYCFVSNTGHKISRSIVDDQDMYTAWARCKGGHEPLLYTSDKMKAVEACEQDADQESERLP